MDDEKKDALHHGLKWNYRTHNFKGYSIAGTTTSVVYENEKAAFDLGQGLPFNIPSNHIFLTHGHGDHAAGLPYVLSQRSLWGLPTANVYVGSHYYKNLEKLLAITQDMEGFKYNYHLHVMEPGDSVEISPGTTVEAFQTIHRVPSQGYALSKKKKSLKPEFTATPQEELIRIKNSGQAIENIIDESIFAFTGDTQIEFLQYLKPTKVLFMETTFIDHKKSVTSAREWGHIHLDEWIDLIEEMPVEKIVVIHVSARYSTNFINMMFEQKIPQKVKDKVTLFPRPF